MNGIDRQRLRAGNFVSNNGRVLYHQYPAAPVQ